jgi:CTP:molybdopterin cytidylyltransferase MocA
MPVPAILLAAGASRRLGQPKQLVRIASETLLARTIRVVREAGADPVLVLLGANRESIAEAVDLSRVRVVVNPDWEQGIASSIHAGVEALLRLEPDADAAMILVCDQPRLAADHLKLLIGRFEQAERPSIVSSRYAGIAGIPAIFPASQFSNLLALKGDAGARFLLRNPACPMIAVDFAGGEADIDTPEDLAQVTSDGL